MNNNNSTENVISSNEVVEVKDQPTEIHESVVFADAAPVDIDSSHDARVDIENPYKHPELTQYLSRVYPITTFEWTSASSQGDLLNEIYLPEALINFRAIAEKLSRFAFLQCKFHISSRVNGTAFH